MKKVMVLCMVVMCLVSFNASAGIIAAYSFDVNAGDDSGNGNHSSLQSGAVAGITDAERGLVLDLTGSAEAYVAVSGSYATGWFTDAITTTATVMMWAKFDNSWAEAPEIFNKAWSLTMGSTSAAGSLYLQGRTAAGVWTTPIYAGASTNDGQWHHFAAAVDNTAGVMTMFIDGAEVGSATFAGPLLATPYVCKLGLKLNGYMDDAIVFDEALDEAGVQSYMSYQVPEPATMLLLGVGAVLLRRRRS